jgi:diguanylate cyclase (GGDEF)-like protein
MQGLSNDRRLMAYTAAAMYGGAVLDELITGFIPGDPHVAPLQLGATVAVVCALLLGGPRLPRWALSTLGPLGVVLIAQALSVAPKAGDAAVLYIWPVLWSTLFFGRRGAAAIVLCVGVAHGAAVLSLPSAGSYVGRWVDVMIVVCVVAGVVLRLIDKNDELLDQLAGEARLDALTGLLNRRGFEERVAPELSRAVRENTSVALATFDIDYFKRINDEWGHEVGDRVLTRIGRLLARESRPTDVVARFGGEEFVVLFAGGDAGVAAAYAERIRAALSSDDGSGLPTVRVSVGIDAVVASEDIQTMHKRADFALYEAKRTGRDRVVLSSRAEGSAIASNPAAEQPARVAH